MIREKSSIFSRGRATAAVLFQDTSMVQNIARSSWLSGNVSGNVGCSAKHDPMGDGSSCCTSLGTFWVHELALHFSYRRRVNALSSKLNAGDQSLPLIAFNRGGQFTFYAVTRCIPQGHTMST